MKQRSPEVTESVSLPEAQPSRIEVREWAIEVVAGPDKGKKVKTLGALIRVGSDPTNDVVLSDATVSRRHLEIERTPRGLMLRDLGSRNGTIVEGRQLLQAFLDPGDKIALGKTKLLVKQQAKGTEIELGGESFGDLVGTSEAMRAVFAELRRVAREEMNLLIEGETGTGKELAARAVHQSSSRRHMPFKVVDCNVISEEAAERELFGHLRGALATSEGSSPGVFEAAQGGTVFLDEVGELPPSLQPKLLRVLESREVHRIGEGKTRQLDVRIIASTHRNLDEEVRAGRFRADLFFRLAVARVHMPPLRTRRQDIPVLAQHVLRNLGTPFEMSAQTLALFEGYDWPGNVRELRNVLERGALMQETGNASWLDFLANPPKKGHEPTKSVGAIVSALAYHEAKDRVLSDFERIYFAEVMKASGFDMKVAEQKTGLSMQSLYRLLKKNGLRLKDLKNAEGL
ncbi:MAG: sigma 54-interacting transcriptional regulator [Myxococcales bacterium]|nr:sigma 54-interacting transcriptional regulator [Myxococcales bacterium]